MGVHSKTKIKQRRVWIRGMLVREYPQHLQVSFSPFGSPWPVVLKRLRTAGLTVAAGMERKPVLRVDTDLDKLVEILQPRAKRSAHGMKLALSITAGFTVLLAALNLPIPLEKTETKIKPNVVDECSLAKLRQVIEGVASPSVVEFQESNSFGGVTLGIVSCKGARYSYTLESKGDERVLKVQKLDT